MPPPPPVAGGVPLTAIPDGNNSNNPNLGGGLGADSVGIYQKRDGGSVQAAASAADMMGRGGGGSGAAHGGRRDGHGAHQQPEPDSAAPSQSFGHNTGSGGGEGAQAWAATDPESFLRENLSLKDLVSLAYMFNFVEVGVLGLGERKAVVQVGRGPGWKRNRAAELAPYNIVYSCCW